MTVFVVHGGPRGPYGGPGSPRGVPRGVPGVPRRLVRLHGDPQDKFHKNASEIQSHNITL